jgi:hypothetical protein
VHPVPLVSSVCYYEESVGGNFAEEGLETGAVVGACAFGPKENGELQRSWNGLTLVDGIIGEINVGKVVL